MKPITKNLSVILIALYLFGCDAATSKGSLEEDTKKLLAIHEQGRTAHFDKNAQLLVDQFAKPMYSVNRGKVSEGSKERAAKSFQSYFDAVEFRKWDDIKPPIIQFSDDRTLGYVIVDKLVVLELADSTGAKIEETTHYAWVSIYRKQDDGNYKLECIASTNEPSVERKLE